MKILFRITRTLVLLLIDIMQVSFSLLVIFTGGVMLIVGFLITLPFILFRAFRFRYAWRSFWGIMSELWALPITLGNRFRYFLVLARARYE